MQCPGQDNRYWDGSEVFESSCPHCGNEIEFFKDDSQRNCSRCGRKVLNPKIDFGCASYCQHAEQCLSSLPAGVLGKEGDSLKERLLTNIRKKMIDDIAGYELVCLRAKYGEDICVAEGGNMSMIIASTLLSKADDPVSILMEENADERLVEEVVHLLSGNNLPDKLKESAAILNDSCLLADIETASKAVDLNTFSTKMGKLIAEKLLNASQK